VVFKKGRSPRIKNRRPLRVPKLRRLPIRRRSITERELLFLDVPDATNPGAISGSENFFGNEDLRGPPEEVDPNGFGLDQPRFRRK